MQKEILNSANEILNEIRLNEQVIKLLEEFSGNGGMLYTMQKPHPFCENYESMYFEPWEIDSMICNKKKLIADLEKKLEEL